jgi:FtsH-binding integral membrane protein
MDITFADFNSNDSKVDKSYLKKKMNSENRKAFVPIVLVFIILNGLIFFSQSFLDNPGFDRDFLLWSNLFLFLISLGGFLRGVYTSMLFKMFICMTAVLIYVFLFRSNINKPGIFTAMGMYVAYTVVEVSTLMNTTRKKRNA